MGKQSCNMQPKHTLSSAGLGLKAAGLGVARLRFRFRAWVGRGVWNLGFCEVWLGVMTSRLAVL